MNDINELRKRMINALDSLQKEFASLRAGRVSSSILDGVVVDSYGTMMHIDKVASISALDARTLSIKVWDRNLVKSVEKAISDSGLGLNPINEGQAIRISVPELSEERRKELCKVAAKYAEHSRVFIRNIRRDGMELIKKQEKEKQISEDESKKLSEQVQKLTDEFIKKVDEALSIKEKDIMKV